MITYKPCEEMLPPPSNDVREILRLCALEKAEEIRDLEDRQIMAAIFPPLVLRGL